MMSGLRMFLVAGTIDASFYGEARPVVAYMDDQVFVAWKESAASGFKYRIWSLTSNSWKSSIPKNVDNTDSGSKNISIAVQQNINSGTDYCGLVWQQDNLSIKYQNYGKNTIKFQELTTVSSGSGFTKHYNPSITGNENGVGPIISWTGSKKVYVTSLAKTSAGGGGGTWVWQDYAVVKANPSGSTFYSYGNTVDYTNANIADDGNAIIALSKSNGAGSKFIKRTASGSYSVNTLSHNGIQIQVSNGATANDMKMVVFNKSSLPFRFDKSTSGFPKINVPGDLVASRQGVVTKGDMEFVFNIGDIRNEGAQVNFIPFPDTSKIELLDELNDNVHSAGFYLTTNSTLLFSHNYYVVNPEAAESQLSVEDEVRFKVQLVHAATNQVAATVDQVTYNQNNVDDYAQIDYQLDCSGIQAGDYYLRLVTEVDGAGEFTLGNGRAEDNELPKLTVRQIRFEEIAVPITYNLAQNHPNPFNPSTVINYELSQPGNVVLKVYDISGREITTLVNGYMDSGRYQVVFDAGRLATGVYVYRIVSGNFTAQKKMLLIK